MKNICINEDEIDSYLATALWAGTLLDTLEYEGATYKEGTSLEDIISVDDIPPAVREQVRTDLEGFANYCFDTLGFDPLEAFDPHQVAHDFYLSRNGHGAGFFDGAYVFRGKRNADDLQTAAKTFGTRELEVWIDAKGALRVGSRS